MRAARSRSRDAPTANDVHDDAEEREEQQEVNGHGADVHDRESADPGDGKNECEDNEHGALLGFTLAAAFRGGPDMPRPISQDRASGLGLESPGDRGFDAPPTRLGRYHTVPLIPSVARVLVFAPVNLSLNNRGIGKAVPF
jgi:hypothetical protein